MALWMALAGNRWARMCERPWIQHVSWGIFFFEFLNEGFWVFCRNQGVFGAVVDEDGWAVSGDVGDRGGLFVEVRDEGFWPGFRGEGDVFLDGKLR